MKTIGFKNLKTILLERGLIKEGSEKWLLFYNNNNKKVEGFLVKSPKGWYLQDKETKQKVSPEIGPFPDMNVALKMYEIPKENLQKRFKT